MVAPPGRPFGLLMFPRVPSVGRPLVPRVPSVAWGSSLVSSPSLFCWGLAGPAGSLWGLGPFPRFVAVVVLLGPGGPRGFPLWLGALPRFVAVVVLRAWRVPRVPSGAWGLSLVLSPSLFCWAWRVPSGLGGPSSVVSSPSGLWPPPPGGPSAGCGSPPGGRRRHRRRAWRCGLVWEH